MPYCKKCGEKLGFGDGILYDLCSFCYNDERHPLTQPGKIDVVHLSPKDYEKWLRTHGSKVDIINVQKEGGGLYSGASGIVPISYRRTDRYRVTYRTPKPAAQVVYAQPTVYEEARATGHPVYEQRQPPQAPMPVYSAGDRKNPGVAAVLSFFWAGLGQIYNGQLLKGIGFIVLYAFSVLLIFAAIGLILVPIVWIIGIGDAYSTAKSYNERQLQNEMAYYASLARR